MGSKQVVHAASLRHLRRQEIRLFLGPATGSNSFCPISVSGTGSSSLRLHLHAGSPNRAMNAAPYCASRPGRAPRSSRRPFFEGQIANAEESGGRSRGRGHADAGTCPESMLATVACRPSHRPRGTQNHLCDVTPETMTSGRLGTLGLYLSINACDSRPSSAGRRTLR